MRMCWELNSSPPHADLSSWSLILLQHQLLQLLLGHRQTQTKLQREEVAGGYSAQPKPQQQESLVWALSLRLPLKTSLLRSHSELHPYRLQHCPKSSVF